MSHHRSETPAQLSGGVVWCSLAILAETSCISFPIMNSFCIQWLIIFNFVYFLLLKFCWNPPNRIVGGGGGGASR